MLGWLQGNHDIGALIARKQYGKAIKILKARLQREPDSVHLRQLYSDALWYDGRKNEAVGVLSGLVDEFADNGFVTKGIAVLKKIQRIEPDHPDTTSKMSRLIRVREQQSGLIKRPTAQELATADSAQTDTRETAGRRAMLTSEVVLSEDWFEEAAEEREDFQWSPLFSGFSKIELEAFLGDLKLLVKNPGSIIYSQGQPGNSLFILASGQARVYSRRYDASQQQVKVLREGDIFGKPSVLTGKDREHTVTAASECELLELDKSTFDAIVEHHPRVRKIFQDLYDNDLF